MLQGIKVLDLAGEPLAMTGRILSDLGAEVVKLEPPGGDPLRQAPPLDPGCGVSLRFIAWNAGKVSIEGLATDARVEALLRGADVVIETPRFAGTSELSPTQAPQAIWLKATPFGLDGPRANWRASDLGIMAASGNMYATGSPDRAPIRCSEPTAYAHASAEAAFAILTALASGRPQVIDLSMQETILMANMGGAGQFPKTQNRGKRRGALMGRTREIWPCKDGYVSFGLRGGRARARNFEVLLEELTRENLATPAWSERDWASFDPQVLDSEELSEIEAALMAYFARHSMAQLYELAATANLMLAPANSPAEILSSTQLDARDMFATLGTITQFPKRFVVVRDPDQGIQRPEASRPAPALAQGPYPQWAPKPAAGKNNEASPQALLSQPDQATPAWAGLKLLEFGSGAAAPLASRYFAEHGATVIKIESRSRPEFLRAMAHNSPQGLEGSTLFDALNPGKHSITINLKSPQGVAIAKQLIHWADAVLENFAPSGMKRFGLDYEQMVLEKPDLVMLSTCLNGQTGPHRDFPGFGGQGSALAGFNFLTGWPDREPIGPFGTITDSLAPRFSASALAAALLYRRRTGRGLHLDISQVETAVYSLSPWLLDYAVNGESCSRQGNRSLRAAPHGAFPCQGEDRWIAIACWSDHEWQQLATIIGIDPESYPSLESRLAAQETLEATISAWTRQQQAPSLAEQLQSRGIEAVPVADFEDLLERDPQLQHREHFVHLERPLTGESIYERNGFRLSAATSTYSRPAPLLGEHTDELLTALFAYSPAQLADLRASGAIE